MTPYEWHRDAYLISTDPNKLDSSFIHTFLSQSYWAAGIPRDTVERSLEHSLAFGVYHGAQQIGLARVISDYTTFAYVADVFIDEHFRGQGLATWLIETVVQHPDLQNLRRWMLFTKDAHDLYRKVGFTPLLRPERAMEKSDPDIYKRVSEEKAS